MIGRNVIAAACLVWGLGVEAMAAPAEVELRARVRLNSPDAVLGDIAAIRSPDLATVRRLVVIPVAPSLRPGVERTIEQSEAMRQVRAALGTAAGELQWTGAAQSVVMLSSQEVPGTLIEQTARVALRGWLAARAVPAQTELMHAVPDLVLPAGQLDLRVRPIALQPRAQTHTTWVDLQLDGQFVRSVPVSFRVPGAVGLELPGIQGMAVTTAAVTGARVVAAPATPVRGAERGQKLLLISRQGDLELHSSGAATTDANVGERVQVRVPYSPAPVEARLVGRGQAEALP